MDVTCERCGTVYEFDETLVSGRGTTVKCTQCNHVFKVTPPGATPSSRPGWQVRRQDGAVMEVESLKVLQRRIAQGHLSEDDTISRDGTVWKRLGDIAELQSFFETSQAPVPPERERKQTQLGVGVAPPSEPPAGAAPPKEDAGAARPADPDATRPADDAKATRPAASGGRQHKSTLLGMGLPGADTASTSDAPPPSPAEPPANSPSPVPSEPPEGAWTEGPGLRGAAPPAAGRTAGTPSEPPEGAWAEGPGLQGAAPGGSEAAGEKEASAPAPEAYADTLRAIENAPSSARRSMPTVADAPRPPSGRPAAPREAGPPQPARRQPRRALYVDETDEAPPRPPRRSRNWIPFVVVLLVLAASTGVWLAWPQIGDRLRLGEEPERIVPFLERAEAAMAEDHADAYDTAIEELIRATAIDADDARALTGLAHAHALWAQELLFDASDLEARAAEDPTLGGEARRARREAERHAADAERYAQSAVTQDPDDPRARLVLADALRLAGDLTKAREELAQARRVFETPPAELHRVAGLLAMAEADGDVAAAREEAEQAVEVDANLLRARLLLVRALLADQDVAAARAQVRGVMGLHPGHPRAKDLEDAIEQGVPPAAPVMEVLDGGTRSDAGADAGSAAEESEEAEEAEEAEEEDSTATTSDTSNVPAGRDYDWYVQRGEKLIEQGSVGQARRMFDAALGRRPGGPEALTGLGYVALDGGDASEAVRRFEPAARSGHAEAHIGLGDALRRLNRPKRALRAYKDYLSQRPNGAQASIARRQIAQLEASEGGKEAEPPAEDSASEPSPQEDASDALPAPKDTDPEDFPPESDPPAIGSE